MAALRPEFGPSLPTVIAPRVRSTPAKVRAVLLTVVGLLILIQLGRIVVAHRTKGPPHDVFVRGSIPFTLAYRDGVHQVKPPPAGLALQLVTRGADPQSMTVSTEAYSPGPGDPSAGLAVRAANEVTALRKAYPTGFLYRGDGRTRINLLPGHQILFQATIGGRTTYGKRFLLVPDVPQPRQLAVLTLLSARSGAIPNVDSVGSIGLLKTALRSFRFGTERP